MGKGYEEDETATGLLTFFFEQLQVFLLHWLQVQFLDLFVRKSRDADGGDDVRVRQQQPFLRGGGGFDSIVVVRSHTERGKERKKKIIMKCSDWNNYLLLQSKGGVGCGERNKTKAKRKAVSLIVEWVTVKCCEEHGTFVADNFKGNTEHGNQITPRCWYWLIFAPQVYMNKWQGINLNSKEEDNLFDGEVYIGWCSTSMCD